MKNRLNAFLALFIAAVAFVAVKPSADVVFAATQAGSDKLVQTDAQYRESAVWITKITVGDREVQCGLLVGPHEVQPVAPFQAGDDWLQDMTVYLYNRTDRAIVFAQVVLVFPQTGDGTTQPRLAHYIQLGRLPAAAAFSGRTGKPIPQDPSLKPLLFLPGPLVIHVGDYIDQIKQSLGQTLPLSSITECIVRKGTFVFGDGMRWSANGFNVPDPEHPGQFKRLDENFFPGNKYRNRPPGYQY